jgi:hypothetical protein
VIAVGEVLPGTTVTVTWSVFTHPSTVVVNVYVVVLAGFAIGFGIFVALRPIAGDQE